MNSPGDAVNREALNREALNRDAPNREALNREAPRHEVLRVDDLVSTTSLDVTVLAGGAGLNREVLWAHSCEMSDPERWLGPHELLMTVGLCVPEDAEAQVGFVGRLDDAGLAGLMIGDHETAPPVSDAMLAEADRRAFPVLLAATHTPYAVVARHVAAANMSSQTLQVLKLSKLYHVTASIDDADDLVMNLVSLLGVDIRVEDRTTGVSVVAAEHPSRARPQSTPRRYTLRGQHPADLFLSEYPGEQLDGMVLVHLLKVLEVTVDRAVSAADLRSTKAAGILLALLNGNQPPELAGFLAPYRASNGFHVVAFASEHAAHVARAAALRGLPVLVGPGRTSPLALIPVDLVPLIREMAEARGISVGVSSVFTDYQDVRIAANEAASVFAASQHSGRSWMQFKGTMISVLSRSRQEADEIIAGVLGPLAEDTASATKLRDTLFAFLRNDRRWQDTADELGIHRQTLSYRLNRIAEETGADLARSADLSAFWIAYQAWESTHN